MSQIITDLMIKTSYDYAKEAFHDQIELNHALNNITTLSGMHRGSALAYISNFRLMMKGEVYKRTMKTDATKYFLINIYKDYGIEYFSKALKSVTLHINYYKSIKDINLTSIKKIIEELKNKEEIEIAAKRRISTIEQV